MTFIEGIYVGYGNEFCWSILSEDLTGLEDLSGLIVRIRICRIREFSEWGGVSFCNSKILEILILTISPPCTTNYEIP